MGIPMSASSTHTPEDLAELGARHLWLHFSRMGAYGTEAMKIIERGEGSWLYDIHGKKYLDGLSGLFTVQVGHGRRELAEAAMAQASELSYFPIWGYAHPTAIELAAALAERAPSDLNRVFFTTSGSEAVESAWKLARQYHQLRGDHRRYKVISRNTSYHGTSLGALAITGVPALRQAFEPLAPGARHVPNTDRYRPFIEGLDEAEFSKACADAIEQMILMEGPDTVAAVFLEPLQNAGGCFTPPEGYFQRVREICDR
ncbi:MAG: aminotransferase class III-fold pyridoxal phosphate-dependent enzyme, partial [Actinobacteria bacterium]|nr:aminotransferase class III-fold pyridoxal phosphate-dependent enzyme [Actinomycetota bacterium]